MNICSEHAWSGDDGCPRCCDRIEKINRHRAWVAEVERRDELLARIEEAHHMIHALRAQVEELRKLLQPALANGVLPIGLAMDIEACLAEK